VKRQLKDRDRLLVTATVADRHDLMLDGQVNLVDRDGDPERSVCPKESFDAGDVEQEAGSSSATLM
jgi:hypothetical protein